MIALSLFRKKDLLVFLLTLFLFSFLSVSAQTVIREKVSIKPTAKRLLNTQTDYSPLVFNFHGVYFVDVDGIVHDFPYNVSIECTNGNSTQSNCPGGDGQVNLTMPAINGEYTVTVNSLRDYGSSSIDYSVTWIDPSGYKQQIDGFEMWFHNLPGNVHTQCITQFPFYGIPAEPAPSDFYMSLSDSVVYGTEESQVYFGFSGEDPPTSASVSLSIECTDPDVVFFNRNLWQNAGRSLTASLDEYETYSVKSNSTNQDYPKHVKVVAVCNGIQREDTVMIVQPNYVRAYFEKESLSPGDTVNIIIRKVDNHYGWESDYPDTTHFEVGIKEGCELGNILSAEGDTAKFFPSITQPIRFIMADSISAGADSVVLRVGAPVITASEPIILGAKVETKNEKNISVTSAESKTQTNRRNSKVAEGNYCAAGSYTYADYSLPEAKVGGDCNTADKCSYEMQPPLLVFNQTNHKDPCKEPLTYGRISWKLYDYPNFWESEGYDISKYPELISNHDLKICYDEDNNMWKYKYNSENKIKIGYNLTWCESKIKERHEVILSEIDDLNNIKDTSEIKLAIRSIDSLNQYPLPAKGLKYGIPDVYFYHEIYHKDDFERLVTNEYYKSDLFKKFTSLNISCSEVKSLKSFEAIVKQLVEQLRGDFQDITRKLLWNKFLKKTKDKNGSLINQNETDTQTKAWENYARKFVIELENKLKEIREGNTK